MRFVPAMVFSAVALAQPVAPISVTFSDTIAEETRVRLWERLSEGLAEEGFELVPSESVRDKLATAALPAGCIAGPCLKEVGAALSVKYTLVGVVDGLGSSFDVVITAMETQGGLPVAQAIERCDVCSMMDVEASMGRAASKVAADLTLHANPPPAPLPPREIVRTPPPPKSIWRWRGWKWVSLGLGAAAAGVGTYLVQIDGCTDAACTDQRHTGNAGMIAVGTGVVMMGGAGYLFAFGF